MALHPPLEPEEPLELDEELVLQVLSRAASRVQEEGSWEALAPFLKQASLHAKSPGVQASKHAPTSKPAHLSNASFVPHA